MSPEDKRPITRGTVRRVVATFRPYRPQVTVVAIAIVVTSVLGVFNPLLTFCLYSARFTLVIFVRHSGPGGAFPGTPAFLSPIENPTIRHPSQRIEMRSVGLDGLIIPDARWPSAARR